MDSESLDSKAEFRKPSSDAANRKYRRRSPPGGASPSPDDGSPRRERNSSPVPSKKDITRVADDKWKKDDGRNRSDRGGESYKYSDRQSSRSYHRHDDHSRRDRQTDDYDRGYSKSSYNSGRRHANIEERDSDRCRQKESRGDRYGKTDHRKNSGDYKSDRSPAYEESKGQRNDSSSRRDSSGHRNKEASSRDLKERDAEKYGNDDKRRRDDQGIYKEKGNGEPKEHSDDKSIEGQDSVAKRPKVFSLFSSGPATDGTSEQAVTDSDIDAAKIAAMKAAELVNKNLVGTCYMSTDQKKKLLWGSKKNTATEEPAHRWDTTTFGDRDRQEKFNKLMGVKRDTSVELKGDNPDVEKQREQLQMDLEKQYTAGLRRRDGRTVGLGL